MHWVMTLGGAARVCLLGDERMRTMLTSHVSSGRAAVGVAGRRSGRRTAAAVWFSRKVSRPETRRREQENR